MKVTTRDPFPITQSYQYPYSRALHPPAIGGKRTEGATYAYLIATRGEDNSRGVRAGCAKGRDRGRRGWMHEDEGEAMGGGGKGASQGGGRVELSEAETFWDGPHPSRRSRRRRRPPRL